MRVREQIFLQSWFLCWMWHMLRNHVTFKQHENLSKILIFHLPTLPSLTFSAAQRRFIVFQSLYIIICLNNSQDFFCRSYFAPLGFSSSMNLLCFHVRMKKIIIIKKSPFCCNNWRWWSTIFFLLLFSSTLLLACLFFI